MRIPMVKLHKEVEYDFCFEEYVTEYVSVSNVFQNRLKEYAEYVSLD